MRKLLKKTALSFLIITFAVLLSAEVKVKVKGTVATTRKKPKPEEIQVAVKNAKIQAIKKYASGIDSQKLIIITGLLPKIEADLGNYILDVSYLDEGETINGAWEQLMEVTVNDAQLELLINQQAKSKMDAAEPNYISFIYVAREVGAVETHAATKQSYASSDSKLRLADEGHSTKVSTTEAKAKVNEVVEQDLEAEVTTNTTLEGSLDVNTNVSSSSAEIKGSSSYSDGNTNVKAKINAKESSASSNTNFSGQTQETVDTSGNATLTTDTTIRGKAVVREQADRNSSMRSDLSTEDKSLSYGSVTNISEGISYRAYNPGEIDAKVTEIFNKAYFEVIPAYEVDIAPEKFAYDFASLNDISSATQKEATDLARAAELDFLAVAMLDVGREAIDPVTGSYKIYVKTNGYIMDLRKKFAVKVCSVGPVQCSGLGENPAVAKTNALIEASTKTSQDLVDQLRVKLGM